MFKCFFKCSKEGYCEYGGYVMCYASDIIEYDSGTIKVFLGKLLIT